MSRQPGESPQRPLGPRALRTRERLLRTTAELLAERGLRDLAVVEVARRAGTSPATFYQYFGGALEATLELAELASRDLEPLVAGLEGSFEGDAGLNRARAFVADFFALWERHRAVWRVRNHSAEEGDSRFRRVRRKALRPLLDRLAQALPDSGDTEGVHPYAVAAALATILESLGAYGPELERFDVDRDALIETASRILVDTITERGAAR